MRLLPGAWVGAAACRGKARPAPAPRQEAGQQTARLGSARVAATATHAAARLPDERTLPLWSQVPSDAVYVTRFMGDYTETVAPDEFDALPVRCAATAAAAAAGGAQRRAGAEHWACAPGTGVPLPLRHAGAAEGP